MILTVAAGMGCSGQTDKLQDGPDSAATGTARSAVDSSASVLRAVKEDAATTGMPARSRKVLDRAVIVFKTASPEELDNLRDEQPDAFSVIVDDMLWYRATARQLLEGIGPAVLEIEGKEPLEFRSGADIHRFDWDSAPWLDVIILFSPGRAPFPLAPADLSADTTLVVNYFDTAVESR